MFNFKPLLKSVSIVILSESVEKYSQIKHSLRHKNSSQQICVREGQGVDFHFQTAHVTRH